jgi:hypothetical protein
VRGCPPSCQRAWSPERPLTLTSRQEREATASEEIAKAERDEVVPGGGETVKRIAAVLVVLLDE